MHHARFVTTQDLENIWELICTHPEEFVVAGDFLAYKFPVWSWSV